MRSISAKIKATFGHTAYMELFAALSTFKASFDWKQFLLDMEESRFRSVCLFLSGLISVMESEEGEFHEILTDEEGLGLTGKFLSLLVGEINHASLIR